ncbi:MAG: glycosyltransferase family 2 protein [Sphingomonas sp.]
MAGEPARSGGVAPAAAPAVSILIVGYNSAAHIVDCIGSIERWVTGCRYEIVLIDNGDGSTEAVVRAQFPSVLIVPSQGNIGFGAGCNRVAAQARADKLLFLNPDTKLTDDAVSALLAFSAERPGAGAWGGRTVSDAGVFDGGNLILLPSFSRLLVATLGLSRIFGPTIAFEAETAPSEVDVLCGGFFMMDRTIWARLGGFDESFFLYSEEVDLFFRLKAAGLQAWVTPAARIVHDVGSGGAQSPARIRYRTAGQMHFIRKYWSVPGMLVAGAVIWAGAAARYAAGLALGRTSGRFRALRDAYGPLVRNPGLWFFGYTRNRH